MGRDDESRPLWIEAAGWYQDPGIAEGVEECARHVHQMTPRGSRLRPDQHRGTLKVAKPTNAVEKVQWLCQLRRRRVSIIDRSARTASASGSPGR